MKMFNFVILSFILSNCSAQENEIINHSSKALDSLLSKKPIEQKALDFFTDSLLYKKDIFSPKNENLNSLQTALALPIMDKSLYENGLFCGKWIYTNGKTFGLSKPYEDTINFELNKKYISKYNINELHDLYKDYWNRVYNIDTLNLKITEPIKLLSLDNFEKNMLHKNNLFAKVHNYLKAKDKYFVQIEICDIDFRGAYESYNFYIMFDLTKTEVSWAYFYPPTDFYRGEPINE